VSKALQEKLAAGTGAAGPVEPGWMRGFGKLRRLRKETKRIQLLRFVSLEMTTSDP
jgi:hypothetical protein